MFHPQMFFGKIEPGSREAFLFHVVSSFTATSEEQEEWRNLMREKVIAGFNRDEEWRKNPEEMKIKEKILTFENDTIESRKTLNGLERANRQQIRADFWKQRPDFMVNHYFNDGLILNGFRDGSDWP